MVGTGGWVWVTKRVDVDLGVDLDLGVVWWLPPYLLGDLSFRQTRRLQHRLLLLQRLFVLLDLRRLLRGPALAGLRVWVWVSGLGLESGG